MNKNTAQSAPEPMSKAVRRIAVRDDTTVAEGVRKINPAPCEGGKPVMETTSHKERLRRLDAIWKVVDREKARVGKRVTRAMAYEH